MHSVGEGPAPPSPAAIPPRWSWTCKCAALHPQVLAPPHDLPLTLTKLQASPAQSHPTQVMGTRAVLLHCQTPHFRTATLVGQIRCISAKLPLPLCPVQTFRHRSLAQKLRCLSLAQTVLCLPLKAWRPPQRSKHLSQVQVRMNRHRLDFCLPCLAQARTSPPHAEVEPRPHCRVPRQTSLPPAVPQFPFQGQAPCVPCLCHHDDCSMCPCQVPHFLDLQTHGPAVSLSLVLVTPARHRLGAPLGLCQ